MSLRHFVASRLVREFQNFRISEFLPTASQWSQRAQPESFSKVAVCCSVLQLRLGIRLTNSAVLRIRLTNSEPVPLRRIKTALFVSRQPLRPLFWRGYTQRYLCAEGDRRSHSQKLWLGIRLTNSAVLIRRKGTFTPIPRKTFAANHNSPSRGIRLTDSAVCEDLAQRYLWAHFWFGSKVVQFLILHYL